MPSGQLSRALGHTQNMLEGLYLPTGPGMTRTSKRLRFGPSCWAFWVTRRWSTSQLKTPKKVQNTESTTLKKCFFPRFPGTHIQKKVNTAHDCGRKLIQSQDQICNHHTAHQLLSCTSLYTIWKPLITGFIFEFSERDVFRKICLEIN